MFASSVSPQLTSNFKTDSIILGNIAIKGYLLNVSLSTSGILRYAITKLLLELLYDKYFMDRYGWSKTKTIHDIIDDDDYLKELYHKIIEYINDGFIIAEKRVDYSDECTQGIIRMLAKDNDSFILLEDD